jgi:hypothetical protein
MAGAALSPRRPRFVQLLVDADRLSTEQLVVAIRAKFSVSALGRCAALRTLIARAPIEVTRGQPYLVRRRYVREHDQV